MRRRSWPSRLLRSAAQGLGVLALTVGLGEGVARLAGVQPLNDASLLWIHHPRWGWHHQPNAEDTFVKLGFSQRIQINSKGLREREIPYEKAPGTLRVLVIGDSSVASFEVPPEATFTRIVEDRLRARGLAVEVVNAGVRCWGTDQALLWLEDEGVRYHPDLVLYKWTINDRDDNATIHRPFRKFGKPWFDLDASGRLALRGTPVPVYPYAANLRVGDSGQMQDLEVPLQTQASLWLRDAALAHSAFAAALLRIAMATPAAARSLTGMGSYDDTRDVPGALATQSRLFRVTVEMVREMGRVATGVGARFAMIGETGSPTDWGPAVRDAAGLPDLHDVERYLATIPPGAEVLAPYDPHWNQLGHRLYGETLARLLAASGLLGPPAAGTATGG